MMDRDYGAQERGFNTAGNLQAQQGRAIGGLNAPPPKNNPSCFGNLDDARSAAEATASRVEHMVDRLCGSVPTPAETGETIRGNACLFDGADQNAHAIRASMARISVALDRLDKQLP